MKKYHLIQIINALPFFWLFSGYLLVKNGQTYMAYLLILATIFNLALSKERLKIRNQKYLLVSVVIYCIVLIINYLYTSEFWPVIRSSLYFIPFAATTPINKKTIERTLLILPITSIALSYQYFNNGDSRYLDSSGLNPIPLATVIALYLSFAISKLIEVSDEKWTKLYFLTAIPLLTYAILKTETRGVWLVVICYISLLLLYSIRKIANKSSLKRFIIIILIPVIYISYAYYEVASDRIVNTQQEIAQISSGDYNTSIGVRLELWITSIQLLRENHFIFPFNETEISSYFHEKFESGEITEITLKYSSNAHNQYLNSWLRSGIAGFIATLLLIFYPTKKAIAQYGCKASMLPIMITSVIFICGLTELPLTQISAYQAFLMSMLASLTMLDRTK